MKKSDGMITSTTLSTKFHQKSEYCVLRTGIGRSSLKNIYTSLIRPKLEYSDVVWDGLCTSAQEVSLERLQLECIRIFTGLGSH